MPDYPYCNEEANGYAPGIDAEKEYQVDSGVPVSKAPASARVVPGFIARNDLLGDEGKAAAPKYVYASHNSAAIPTCRKIRTAATVADARVVAREPKIMSQPFPLLLGTV